MAQTPPGVARVERSLGIIAGTISVTACFLVSFFLMFGSDLPPGLPVVFVTLTVVVALIPISIAGVRLARGIRYARAHAGGVVVVSRVVTRSVVCSLIVNVAITVLGAVASMGWLISAAFLYLIVSAVPVVALAAVLGWGAAELLRRRASHAGAALP